MDKRLSFVAGAELIPRKAQLLEHVMVKFRGRRSTRSTLWLFFLGAALAAPCGQFPWQARHLERVVVVAGAALEAHYDSISWHAQHLKERYFQISG